MSQFRRLFKHSAIYAIGTVAQSAVAFLLIPVYTRYLSTANYGRLEIINTFGSILLMLITFGFGSAIMKTYFRDAKSEKERKELVGTMFLFVMPIAFAVVALLIFFSPQISAWLLGSREWAYLFRLLFISLFFMAFMNLAFALLRVKERSVKYTVLFLIRFFVVLGLNFYFIIWLKLDVKGILLANVIAFVIVSISLFPDVFKESKFKFSKIFFKKLWAFGLPIIPASIAVWVMDLSDRYFLEIFRTSEEVGIYSLGYKIGMIVDIVLVAPFQLTWPTFYFDISKKENASEIYARVLTYFTLAGTFFALILGMLAPEVIRLIAGQAFWDASKVVMLVAISYVFYGMHYVLAPGIHIKEKTKYYPLLVVIPAIINIILNYFIVPRYGMMGAAATTVASFILVIVITYLVANHYYPVKYDWKRIWGVWILGAAVFAASLFVKVDNLWLSMALKILILGLYAALLFAFGYLRKNELLKIKSMFRRK